MVQCSHGVVREKRTKTIIFVGFVVYFKGSDRSNAAFPMSRWNEWRRRGDIIVRLHCRESRIKIKMKLKENAKLKTKLIK
jgi:hypothetical protein